MEELDILWRQEALKELLGLSECGVLVINTDRIIVYANQWACDFLDIPREAFLHQPTTKFFPQSRLVRVMESGRAERNQPAVRNNKKLMVHRIPLAKRGHILGAMAIFQDFAAYQDNHPEEREKYAEKGLVAKYTFQDIIHQSRSIDHAIATAKSYAKTSSTILITGETGTGKELFAQSIHNYSPRRDKPFVALNCATLPESILEAELFGYSDASFTGAKKGGKEGLFQLANGGTIFLDEIGEIPMTFQSKFLRALQEKEIRPVGSDTIIPINVRVIAATNKNLFEAVQQGTFRLDLLYRINVLNLHIPPLRERREDIPAIAANYFDQRNFPLYAQNKDLIFEVLSALRDYPFLGNIRELENILERLNLILLEGLLEKDVNVILNQLIDVHTYQSFDRPKTVKGSLEMEERQAIIDLLLKLKGNKNEVAKYLGISPSTLWRRMKEYDIK